MRTPGGNTKRTVLLLAIVVIVGINLVLANTINIATTNSSQLEKFEGSGLAGYLLAEATNLQLNLSNPLDAKLAEILERTGPDMRAADGYMDFDDITMELAKRAWSLMHHHAHKATTDKLVKFVPLAQLTLTSAGVSSECHQACMKTLEAAGRFEAWAMQLISSWGNFPPVGVYEGTFSDIGSYHGCLAVPEAPAIEHTHYCSISYRPVLPKRPDYESIFKREPEQLLDMFGKNDGFTNILQQAQYNHYVYYKLGTCFPIKCSPVDVQKLARLLARRSVLMSGPVKCSSKFPNDYEELVNLPTNNQSFPVIKKQLEISTLDLNGGIYIWKPHWTRAQWVALAVVLLVTGLILTLTLVDLIVNIAPRLYKRLLETGDLKIADHRESPKTTGINKKKASPALTTDDKNGPAQIVLCHEQRQDNDIVDKIDKHSCDANNNNNNNKNRFELNILAGSVTILDETLRMKEEMGGRHDKSEKEEQDGHFNGSYDHNNNNNHEPDMRTKPPPPPTTDYSLVVGDASSCLLATREDPLDKEEVCRDRPKAFGGSDNLGGSINNRKSSKLLLTGVHGEAGAKQEVVGHSREKSLFMQIVDDYSIITNAQDFFTISQGQLKNDILCLNGIRCITMSWIILTHTMQYNDWSAFARVREVETHIKSLMNQPIFNATYLVDTFFLLSGILVSFSSFKRRQKRDGTRSRLLENFSTKSYLIGRYLRLTPQIFFVSLLFMLLPLTRNSTGGGPHWYSNTGEYSRLCQENWWINLLHIQAFYKSERMCNFVGWWVSLDMFYHLWALLLILVVYHRGSQWLNKVVWLTIVSYFLGLLIRHYQLGLPPNLLSTIPQTGLMWTDMTLRFFWSPVAHAFPFFFGFLVGYMMAEKEGHLREAFNIRRALYCWLISLGTLLVLLYSTRFWVLGELGYSQPVATAFYATGSVLWTTSLSYMIIACHLGYGGHLNKLLSCKFFLVLSKASYIVYLSHFIIVYSFFGSQSLLLEPSKHMMSYVIIGNICVSMLFGSSLFVVFETPWLKTQKRIMKHVK